MKLLVIKDPHFRKGFGSPKSRVDDYDTTIENKISEIEKISNDNDVDYIIFTGDVLDKKYPSSYSFSAMVNNIEIVERMNKFSKKGILSIAGNHDLPYSTYDNYVNSVYKLLAAHMTDISYSKLTDGDVTIYGIPYVESDKIIDEIRKINDIADENQKNIIVLHEHFIPFDARVDDLKYTAFFRYSDVLQFDKINYFIYGHLHRGFEPVSYELDNGRKQHHINPYSLYRLSRNYYTLSGEHTPEVTLIDTDLDKCENIKLQSKPFDEVFDKTLLNEEINETKSMTEYINAVSKNFSEDDVSFESHIRDLPKNILDIIHTYLKM